MKVLDFGLVKPTALPTTRIHSRPGRPGDRNTRLHGARRRSERRGGPPSRSVFSRCVALPLDRPAGVRRRDRDAGLRSTPASAPIPVAAGAIDGAARLDQLVLDCLAKKPEDRPTSAAGSSDASRKSMSNPGPTFTPGSGGLRRYCRLANRTAPSTRIVRPAPGEVPRGWRLTSARPRVRTDLNPAPARGTNAEFTVPEGSAPCLRESRHPRVPQPTLTSQSARDCAGLGIFPPVRAPSGTDAAVLAPMGRSGFRAPPDCPLHNRSRASRTLSGAIGSYASGTPEQRTPSVRCRSEDVMLVRQIADSKLAQFAY